MSNSAPVTRGRKFLQVLEGARTVFLRDGFEGASVDEIAREAGVSKATLYSYFPDKRMMFIEVFRHELSREAADASALVDVDLPVRKVLPFVVQLISAYRLSDFGLRIYRVSVGEAERFPSLAQEYYNSGPFLLRQQLIAYLRRCVQRGELSIPDLELAADQLIELASATVHDRALFLGRDSVDKDLLQRVHAAAVEMFLSRYGAERAGLAAVAE
ncbi:MULTISPECIES: TetR/AcrR family transcriptional regulator [unclassified Paracoccus (in: a-proteobacteria)]|uniref:TetR/AcrR family transcriptional regulator n=1 Tax=unclassified Paracoccus (in: a-proteobacteria) TaxID=2688777 RepID=UPI0012B2A982|nr:MULTISPECIES: TetR/AcrR family transcriptional regulator [unclassified Paracoccus (in: a-proteobacteria)]UXU75892.1 TetR/AcrR family transcriptional regulator [Paracoccus sp. SMMA_5]UXU81802.1 TetR/AcrR family transcriptional regulator [Paracoccus sp. SMMA_5_TC]